MSQRMCLSVIPRHGNIGVSGVSVCRRPAKTAERIDVLFEVKTAGGTGKIVLDLNWGLEPPPTARGG